MVFGSSANQANPTSRLARCRSPPCVREGQRSPNEPNEPMRVGSRGESIRGNNQIVKERSGARGIFEPRGVVVFENVSLPTDLSRPRAVHFKTPRARSRPSCRFFPPRSSLPTDLSHPRAACWALATRRSFRSASGDSAPTASLCQWTRHVREKQAEEFAPKGGFRKYSPQSPSSTIVRIRERGRRIA